MTITCPRCSHVNDVLLEPPALQWHTVACSACEANLVLVKRADPQDPRPSRTAVTHIKAYK